MESHMCSSKLYLCLLVTYMWRNLHDDIFYKLQFNHEIIIFDINTNVTIGIFAKHIYQLYQA